VGIGIFCSAENVSIDASKHGIDISNLALMAMMEEQSIKPKLIAIIRIRV